MDNTRVIEEATCNVSCKNRKLYVQLVQNNNNENNKASYKPLILIIKFS